MQTLTSQVNPKSQQFLHNKKGMQALLDALAQHLEESRFQGTEHHIAKARKRGKLLARERIELLLDQDSPFLEVMPLTGLGVKGTGTGGTLVCGIGLVSGRLCFIQANVGTKKGGTWDYSTGLKMLRSNEIILENALPIL